MVKEQDIRRLLESEDDAVLALVKGRVLVLSPQEVGSEAHRGALRITSRAEVVEEFGRDELTEYEREELAAKVDAGVSNLGG